MYEILKPIADCGILPIAKFDKKEQAVPFAEAAMEGGMPFIEVLCRTSKSIEAIKEILKKYPDYLVGAGTILNMDQAREAIDAGAKFLVLPGFDPELVDYSLSRNIPIIPGCVTPGEIQQALKMGVTVQKFFPADAFGGPKVLRELAGPYPEVEFVATSVAPENIRDYLACSNINAVGGLFMYDLASFSQGDYQAVAEQFKAFKEEYGRK